MGIDRRSGVGGRESGDGQVELGGRGRDWGWTGGVGWEGERVGIDRRSGVGGGESGDGQVELGGRGREWGWTGGVGREGVGIAEGVSWEGERVETEEEEWGGRGIEWKSGVGEGSRDRQEE